MKYFGCEEEGNMIKVSPNDEIIDAWVVQIGEVDHATRILHLH